MGGGPPFIIHPQTYQPQPYQGQPYQGRPQPQRLAQERAVIRNVRGEEALNAAPAIGKVAVPSPEEAGITGQAAPAARTTAATGEADWAATRRQLAGLGVKEFGLRSKTGGWEFHLVLPGVGRIEAGGSTESEAIAAALADARRPR